MPLIRSASVSLLIEIVIRIGLLSAFCYMETMSPFTRVIHESDLETIYKYPRKESYVPGGSLWVIVLSAPCMLSLIAWAGCNDCNDAFEESLVNGTEMAIPAWIHRFKTLDMPLPLFDRTEMFLSSSDLTHPAGISALLNTVTILLAWSLALGINGVITDTLKLIAGRPRPDFYYRCFPDEEETTNMQCTGDPMVVMEGRKSFPSGHSSLSFCSLGVASLWLCGRLGVLSRNRGSGARVLCCLAPLMMASCVALSRVCDYHHHWEDILFGSLLGFSTAFFCYRQYYNPLSSDLAGLPYIVSNMMSKYSNGKPESPLKEGKEIESTPLLNGAKKDDKWI